MPDVLFMQNLFESCLICLKRKKAKNTHRVPSSNRSPFTLPAQQNKQKSSVCAKDA